MHSPQIQLLTLSCSSLDLSVTSGVDHVLSASSSSASCNVLAAEARQDAGIGTSKSGRVAVSVGLAVVAEVLLAGCVVGSRREELARKTRLSGSLDVLEYVALSDNLGTRVGLEGVSGVGVEVVVDGVDKGVAGDLGGAAGGVVDVVALEGDKVVAAGEVQSPVVVTTNVSISQISDSRRKLTRRKSQTKRWLR